MYAEITAALASVKTFADLTNLVLKTKVDAAIREAAIESQAAIISLQTTMLTLQAEYQSLMREKEQLEQRLIDIENWETEAQNYTLKEVGQGAFVYALKAQEDSTTPLHWLCAYCYYDKQKSVLQKSVWTPMGTTYACYRCKANVFVL